MISQPGRAVRYMSSVGSQRPARRIHYASQIAGDAVEAQYYHHNRACLSCV